MLQFNYDGGLSQRCRPRPTPRQQVTDTWPQGLRQPNRPGTVAGLVPSVGNPSCGTPSPLASVGTQVAPRTRRIQPGPCPVQREAAGPRRGLATGTRGSLGSFARLRCIPKPWRTALALRLGICGSNFQVASLPSSTSTPSRGTLQHHSEALVRFWKAKREAGVIPR